MGKDRIAMTVPAKGEYAKTLRMTAAQLAGRMGMTYDDVDDVRIAAEEAFVYASDTIPDGGSIDVVFTLDDDALEIEVSLGPGLRLDDEDAERRTAYATFILQSVTDRFELSSDEDGAHLRVLKRVELDSCDDDAE